MYLRIVRAQVQPGQLDEFAKRWQEVAGAGIKAVPGFRQGYLGGNRENNRVIGLTVWDSPPDPAHANQVMQQMAERARDIMAGPPEADDYEVLVDV